MAEWGLQAIIRPQEQFDHHHQQQQQQHHDQQDNFYGTIDIKKEYDQALLFCYPHLFDNHHHHHHHDNLDGIITKSTMKKVVYDHDLNQLYNINPVPPCTAVAAAADDDDDIGGGIQINRRHRFQYDSDQDIQRDQQQHHEINKFSGSVSNTSQLAPKLKKRKNQQKRVVVQVTAAGLSSDPWAWRKYGQKPIKGSIYPRSYYRCSSSKACMARRQVEQSCTDSSIYILTYTAEHNHPQPTRRNSLAGINRNRFKTTPPKSPTNSHDHHHSNNNKTTVTKSKTGSQVHSPTTISASSIEDEVIQQSSFIKEDTTLYSTCDINHTMIPEFTDDDCMVFSEDFFEGLEDLGGYKMESSSNYYSSNKQFPHVFC